VYPCQPGQRLGNTTSNQSHKGEAVMKKFVVGGIVLVLVTCGWGTMSVGEQTPAPRGELRIVDTDPLNWAWITWNVFEHLVEIDKDGQLVPRLATAWRWLDDQTLEMTLRQGVKFHNGEVFDADIVKLNLAENTRLRQAHRSGDYWNFKPGSRLEIIDPQTVRFVFPQPDGGALARLTLMHIGNRQFYSEFGWDEKSW
jgi:ABC-type transport system substrate-binding protein